MTTVDDAHQVDADDPVPVFDRHVAELAADGDAGVVDHEIGAAPRAFGERGERLDVGEFRDVGDLDDRFPAGAANALCRGFGRGEIDVADDDARATGGEDVTERTAEAAASAGHDGTHARGKGRHAVSLTLLCQNLARLGPLLAYLG